MIMRADRDNAVRYLGSWGAAVAAVWSLLMIYGRENDWVDRFIFSEIALCGLFACYFIIRYSPKLTVRVIGVFSLFAGIVVLYTAAQLLDLGVWGTPPRFTTPPPDTEVAAVVPYWLRSLGRSMLAVAGPCILWGYYRWWNEETDAVAPEPNRR